MASSCTYCNDTTAITNDQLYDKVVDLAAQIKRHMASHNFTEPAVGIISGTGLETVFERMEKVGQIPYKSLKGMYCSKVPGHANTIVYGVLGGQNVIGFVGRCHFYEGHPMWAVTLHVRIMKVLGVKTLIVTHVCGGLNPSYGIGDIVVLRDHVNLVGMTGHHPLMGENDERWGTRFPHLFNAYDFELRKKIARVFRGLAIPYREGVLCMNCGPTYQSKAEGRFLLRCGVDLVGMSAIPEVIVAIHCGLKVCVFSLVGSAIKYDQMEYEILGEGEDDCELAHFDEMSISTTTNGTSNGHAANESIDGNGEDRIDGVKYEYKVTKSNVRSIVHEDAVQIGNTGGHRIGTIIEKLLQSL